MASGPLPTSKLWPDYFGRPHDNPTRPGCRAFSPDGKRLAGGAVRPPGEGERPGEVKVWGRPAPAGNSSPSRGIRCTVFSPDGSRLAGGSGTKEVKVWDAHAGREVLTLKGHGQVRLMAWPTAPMANTWPAAARTRDGEGLGRPQRQGTPHPQGAHGGGVQRGLRPRCTPPPMPLEVRTGRASRPSPSPSSLPLARYLT